MKFLRQVLGGIKGKRCLRPSERRGVRTKLASPLFADAFVFILFCLFLLIQVARGCHFSEHAASLPAMIKLIFTRAARQKCLLGPGSAFALPTFKLHGRLLDPCAWKPALMIM